VTTLTPLLRPCRRCQIPKPPTEFYADRSKRDGLSRICKACRGVEFAGLKATKRSQQAPARPGARLPVAHDYDSFVALLAQRADTVLGVLLAAAQEGAPDVLERLADALCGPEEDCPDTGADPAVWCDLHNAARVHASELETRFPNLYAALWPPEAPPEDGA
jgi:hypothetical protein